MIEKTLAKLIESGLTISFAESVTGGGLAYELVKEAGASNVIKGSVVAYSSNAKTKVLKVKSNTIKKHGLVSAEVSYEMARFIQKMFCSDLAVSTTGNAGPTFLDQKDRQEVYVTILFHHQQFNYHLTFANETRENVLKSTIRIVYEKIYEILTGFK
ncbi:MAG: CinA family protein [Acholeplasmataceae bacterium]